MKNIDKELMIIDIIRWSLDGKHFKRELDEVSIAGSAMAIECEGANNVVERYMQANDIACSPTIKEEIVGLLNDTIERYINSIAEAYTKVGEYIER